MTERTRGTGSIFKIKGKNRDGTQRESKNWYLAVWHDGKQHRVATGTSIKMRAEQQLQKLLGQIAIGRAPAVSSRKLRYEDIRGLLFDYYEASGKGSLRADKNGVKTIWNLPHVDEFFRCKRLSEINSDLIAAYRKKRAEEGAVLNFLIGYRVAHHDAAPEWHKGDFFGTTFGTRHFAERAGK